MKNNSQISSARQKKDGQLLDVEATLSPIRDRSGAIIGMTGICRDATFGEVNPANKCTEEINGTERKIY